MLNFRHRHANESALVDNRVLGKTRSTSLRTLESISGEFGLFEAYSLICIMLEQEGHYIRFSVLAKWCKRSIQSTCLKKLSTDTWRVGWIKHTIMFEITRTAQRTRASYPRNMLWNDTCQNFWKWSTSNCRVDILKENENVETNPTDKTTAAPM